MSESRIQAVDHVVLAGRPEDREALIWFYGELAELPRRADDASGALCFRSARIELRIRLVAAPVVDAVARRVTIAVRSLEVAEVLLSDRGMPYEWVHGFDWTDRRLVVLDPTGYRVELKQVWSSL